MAYLVYHSRVVRQSKYTQYTLADRVIGSLFDSKIKACKDCEVMVIERLTEMDIYKKGSKRTQINYLE